MKNLLALCFLLVGCDYQSNPPVWDDFPRMTGGHYVASIDIVSSVGNCNWIGELSPYISINVSLSGVFEAPISNLACATTYHQNRKIRLNCTGIFKVEAEGILSSSKTYARGTGTIDGDIGGCKHLSYKWDMVSVP